MLRSPVFLSRSKAAHALHRLLPSLASGLMAGIIAVTVSMAFAALIFTGPLTPFVFSGVGIMLLGGSGLLLVFGALALMVGTPVSVLQFAPLSFRRFWTESVWRVYPLRNARLSDTKTEMGSNNSHSIKVMINPKISTL